MKQIFVMLVVAIAASGCSRFEDWDARFIAFNSSNDDIVVVYGDQETYVPANGSVPFTVKILVPTPPMGTTGPSTVDRTVSINLAVRNLRTGQLTAPFYCQAGAKLVSQVSYQMQSGGYSFASCTAQY